VSDLDVQIFHALREHLSTGGWLVLMSTLTSLGGGWGAALVVPLLARARTRPAGTALAAVLVVTAIVVFALKALVRRKRPYLVLAGVRALALEPPTDFSFPSGHAAGSFAFASFVVSVLLRSRATGAGVWRWWASAALVAVASGVALSRVALGVHFPADVLAGALLGAAFGGIGATWHLRRLAR
jgi:undecaprenyl-diphosphatase